jgi:phosphopantothenoylcysteine decarboxylase/phosphopantothenate--cysteine ligase
MSDTALPKAIDTALPEAIDTALPVHYVDPLAGRSIALGVTGSIAAYKALSLVSGLRQAGAVVDVILSRAAAEFIRPLAFQALSHRPVTTDLWDADAEMAMDHIAIASRADALVVAPATADRIARLALGLAGDALGTTALASTAPLFLAPAMEPKMWAHPATQAHVATLRARGAYFIGPEEGRMASGKLGLGRMAEPLRILDQLRWQLAQHGSLAGLQVLVSAGPTREALDPVRFLSNASTGAMGLAVARAARDRGARVCLVHGPIAGELPVGIEAIAVSTAAEMQAALLDRASQVQLLVMTAAVSDYRPANVQARKIKKQPGGSQLELARNDDILMVLDRQLGQDDGPRPLRVGFAAETEDLIENAQAKLRRKGLDLIVANRVPESFGEGEHRAWFVSPEGQQSYRGQSKLDMAAGLLDVLEKRLRGAASLPST